MDADGTVRIGAVLPAQPDVGTMLAPVLRLGPVGMAVVRLGEQPMPDSWWLEVAARCRSKGVAFAFSHTQGRMLELGPDSLWSTDLVRQVRNAGGDLWLGDVIEHPTASFTFHRSQLGGEHPEPAYFRTMTEAHHALMGELQARAEADIDLGIEPIMALDASLLHGMICEAGVDAPLAYVAAGGPDPMMAMAAARGASAAFGSGEWGIVIGPGLDVRRLSQAAFVAGADYILTAQPDTLEAIQQAVHPWLAVHPRPPAGPFVRVGLLFGNAAGYSGTASTVVWNQWQDLAFEHSDAERDWELVPRLLHEVAPWPDGDLGRATIPLGQLDIVPANAPADALETYSCLIMLGWNTMTDAIYQTLLEYVRSGGHLVAAAPQLSVAEARTQWMEFVRRGDVAELFGCRLLLERDVVQRGARFVLAPACEVYRLPVDATVTIPTGGIHPIEVELTTGRVLAVAETIVSGGGGAPLVVENHCGEGWAYLVPAANYLGSWGMERFGLVLLRMFLAGQQGLVRLFGPRSVQFAVYDEGANGPDCLATAYLLNTDLDLGAECRLEADGLELALRLGPGGMRSAAWHSGCIVSPTSMSACVSAIEMRGSGRYTVLLEGRGSCRLDAADGNGPLRSVEVDLGAGEVEVEIAR